MFYLIFTSVVMMLAYMAMGFAFVLVKFMPFLDPVAKATVVVLATVPAGAVIESLAELYECEQEFAANVVLMTTLISAITIPIMTTLLL